MPPGAVRRFRFLMRFETGKNRLNNSRAWLAHTLMVLRTAAPVTMSSADLFRNSALAFEILSAIMNFSW